MPLGAIEDGLYGLANGTYVNAPEVVALSGSDAEVSAALTHGTYRVVSTVACYLRQSAASGNSATTSYSYLPADTIDFIHVTSASDFVNGITDGGTGNLFLTRL